MNWPLFFSTFVLIFLAELGDKTQLAVMSQSAASSSKWTVFAAGVAALAASTAIGVLAGAVLRRFVPDARYIKVAGGVLFLFFGMAMLVDVFLIRPGMAVGKGSGGADAPGWMGRFVIQQAAIFEKAAFQDYEALAARTSDPVARTVFQRLAMEEHWHHDAMQAVLSTGAEHDMPITEGMAAALPEVSALMQDAAEAPEAIRHAITHEQAMAGFYRTLAEKSRLPRLRETFATLAAAEENHARRLSALAARSSEQHAAGE